MELKNFGHYSYQTTLGILVEISYSLAIILASLAVIYLILILKWFSNRI